MINQGNLILLLVFSIFVLAAVIQLFYYLYYYLAVYNFKPDDSKIEKKGVSVIICARNEADNLKKFLPSILEQDYPDFEVIVVNDCSEDHTDDVLGKFLMQYPRLRISSITKDPKFSHNKKFAQFIGIKAAKNDILIFTDADCQPESDKWIGQMASHYNDKTDFVIGYGGYFREKGVLNKYICYESSVIAMQYFGMAIRGVPYMGVGRNLSYRRSVFFANKGFGSHNHIISGDDDLFVNSHANRENLIAEFNEGSHTRSVPSTELKEWIKQKKRHLTTAPYYKTGDKLRLITEPLTRMVFYITFAVLLSYSFMWPYVIGAFCLRLATQSIVFSLVQKRLNEPRLVILSLIFDIFSPVINSILYLSNIPDRPGKIRWK